MIAAPLWMWLVQVVVPAHERPPSPYAGEEARSIKALSEADERSYLEGAGMGMAKTAELNRYPGPRHVLEHASALALSPAQRESIEASHARMKAEAVALGREVIDAERRLDTLFVSGEASVDAVAQLTQEVARLQGLLRAVHLRAHVEVRGLLTPEQVERYVSLRGYAQQGHEGHGRH